MFKNTKGFAFTLIILIVFITSMVNVFSKEGYEGTYKFTNNQSESVNIRFTEQSNSDIVIYNELGKVTDYILGKNVRKNTTIALQQGYSCVIADLAENITLSAEISAEKKENKPIIHIYEISSDSAYLIENTDSEKHIFKMISRATADFIRYNDSKEVTDYGQGQSFNTYSNAIEGNNSMWIEKGDMQIYYPSEFGFKVTEYENETRFVNHTLVGTSSYTIENTDSEKHIFKMISRATADFIRYNDSKEVTDYGQGQSFNTYSNAIEGNNSMWIEKGDMQIYYPSEFGFKVTEYENETRFINHTLVSTNAYLIKNRRNSVLNFKAKTSAKVNAINYDSFDMIESYELGRNISNYGNNINALYSLWIQDADIEIYYPSEYGFVVTRYSNETRFSRYILQSNSSYLIKNTENYNIYLRSVTNAVGETISYNQAGEITDYNLFTSFVNHGTTIKASMSVWVENIDIELYYPTDYPVEITEYKNQTRFIEHKLQTGNGYRLENTGAVNVSFKAKQKAVGKHIFYKDGKITEYSIMQETKSSNNDLKASSTRWIEDTDAEIYYPAEYSINFTEYENETAFDVLTMDKNLAYTIKNTSSVSCNLLTQSNVTADVIRYDLNGNVLEYASELTIKYSYTIRPENEYAFERCESTFYLPKEYLEKEYITVLVNDKAGFLSEHILSADKVYEIKNTGSTACNLHSEGLGAMRYVVYDASGRINSYKLLKGSVNHSLTLKPGYRYLIENADGKLYFPKEYSNTILISQKSEPVFKTITIGKNSAVKITNSDSESRIICVDKQDYSIVVYKSDSQRHCIEKQNNDFSIYKGKYAVIKNISEDNLVLYAPAEIYNNCLTISYMSEAYFEQVAASYFINVSIVKNLSVVVGDEQNMVVSYLRDYDVSVYNKTTNDSVGFIRASGGVYLSESDVNYGDELTVTLKSRTTVAEAFCVELDENCHAELEATTTELGKISVSCPGMKSGNFGLYVYDAGGKCILRENKSVSSVLADGEYTVIVFNKSGYLPVFDTLTSLDECELVENTHYVKAIAVVNAGYVTALGFDAIPEVTDDDLSYFVKEKTSFNVTTRASMTGDTVLFELNYAIKPSVFEKITSYTFSLGLAEDLILYENSVSYNGENAEYSKSANDNTLNITRTESSGKITFYAKALRHAVYNFKPKVKFFGNGVERSETICSLDFSNQLVTIHTHDVSSDATAFVTGTASANSVVSVYVDDMLLKKVRTGANGAYNTKIELPDAYAGRKYEVYTVMETASVYSRNTFGEALTSDVKNIIYNPLAADVEELWLRIYKDGDVKTYNLLSADVYSITLPLNFNFQYEAKLSGDAREAYIVSDGGYLPLYYDEETGKCMTKLAKQDEFIEARSIVYFYTDPEVQYKNLTKEERSELLPDFLKKDNFEISVVKMPLSEIPQDIIDAYGEERIPEFYYQLRITSKDGTEDIMLPFDMVYYEQSGTDDGDYEKKSDTVGGTDDEAFSNKKAFDYLLSAESDISSITVSSPQIDGQINAFHGGGGGDGLHDDPYVPTDVDRILEDEESYIEAQEYVLNKMPEYEMTMEALREETKQKLNDFLHGWLAEIIETAQVIEDAVNEVNDAVEEIKRISGFIKKILGMDDDEEEKEEEGEDREPEDESFTEKFKKTLAIIWKNYIRDPSGYVYEGYEENRLSGVTVTAYYRDGEEDVKWIAEEYDQKNPLTTDENGWYAWDVPEGVWSVKYEKDGYVTAYREGLVVPPPQTDINVELVAVDGAKISRFYAEGEKLIVEFTKPVFSSDIVRDNLLLAVDGATVEFSIEPAIIYESKYGQLTKKAVISTDVLKSGSTYKITVSDAVRTYNGISAEGIKNLKYNRMSYDTNSKILSVTAHEAVDSCVVICGEYTNSERLIRTHTLKSISLTTGINDIDFSQNVPDSQKNLKFFIFGSMELLNPLFMPYKY